VGGSAPYVGREGGAMERWCVRGTGWRTWLRNGEVVCERDGLAHMAHLAGGAPIGKEAHRMQCATFPPPLRLHAAQVRFAVDRNTDMALFGGR